MKCISLLSLGVATAVWAARIEVVQSVPLETNLAVSGIRHSQEVWLEMIRGAKQTLDIEQFYVSDQAGEALVPVLQAIQDAGVRGVHVRLLADSKFFKTYPDSVTQIGKSKNCEAKTVDFSPTDGVQHSKFFIVDGKDSFVGSQNFDWRALSHIHEIGLRVEDVAVGRRLTDVFLKDWNAGQPVSRSETPSLKDPDEITVVASPPSLSPNGVGSSLTAIVKLMDSAKRSVQIEVMEYTTKGRKVAVWTELDRPIRTAAARGVTVRLLVDLSDVKKAKADLLALSALSNIQVRVVTIPPWSGGAIDHARLIHSKFMVVDGEKAWVGTENWSEGYFFNSRDVGFVTSDRDVVSKLGQIHSKVWDSSYSGPVPTQD